MTPYEQVREEFEFPFELRPYQIERVNDHWVDERAGLYWEAGCVDSETEYLSPTGWVKISHYSGGLVAQFKPDTGVASFVEPEEFIKKPCAEMIRIKTTYGIDQLLSDEHRVLLYRGDRPHVREVISARDLLDRYRTKKSGERAVRRAAGVPVGHAAIRSAFCLEGPTGIKDLTDEQLRLQVAVIADGHFGRGTKTCVVRVKKVRKIERLRLLLEQACVEYREQEVTSGTAVGFHVFTFQAPLRVKEFDSRFWAADKRQVAIMALEVTHWDSSMHPGRRGCSFSSTSKASADFVQYLWVSTGRSVRLSVDTRSDKYTGGVCYTVTLRGEGRASGLLHLYGKTTETMWTEPSTDGFKYCFTVTTGFLVLRRNGCIFTTGNSGKTAGATHLMYFRRRESGVRQWLLIMPPILLTQWGRWLSTTRIKATGLPPTVTIYRGPPKTRQALSLESDFILMSYAIFKNDYERLANHFEGKAVGTLCDEAHAIKNVESQNHKAVRAFAEGRPLLLLTGTPLTTPIDAYAYIKLLETRVIYRNRRNFERIHVEEVDDYGKVLKWRNLDMLEDNMRLHTSRVIRREVQSQLPSITYSPILYDMDPAHLKLYKRIAEERLVEFENGAEINAISTQALYSALQQIVLNWGEFAEDESLRPAALDLVEETLSEIGDDKKLVVVANFIRSNRMLLKALAGYGAVAVYGEVTPANKQRAIQRFIDDPCCRVIILQPQSAGFGVDGLQHVCSDMLVLEAPTTAPPFHQTVARLDRDGQANPVNCRVAVAAQTVQVRMFRNLLENDATINAIQGGYQDLKEAILGN